MEHDQILTLVAAHWGTAGMTDLETEQICAHAAIYDFSQLWERIFGQSASQPLTSHYPGKSSGFGAKRFPKGGDLCSKGRFIGYQAQPAHTASAIEFRDRRVVRESQYLANPFEEPVQTNQRGQRVL